MITPTYDPNISLTENLASNGYGQRAADHGGRMVFELTTGAEIGVMNHISCAVWLEGLARAHETRGIE